MVVEADNNSNCRWRDAGVDDGSLGPDGFLVFVVESMVVIIDAVLIGRRGTAAAKQPRKTETVVDR